MDVNILSYNLFFWEISGRYLGGIWEVSERYPSGIVTIIDIMFLTYVYIYIYLFIYLFIYVFINY